MSGPFTDGREAAEAKKALRPRALKRRARASGQAGAAEAGAEAAARHFLGHFHLQPGCIVAGYWPMRDELDPRPLMEALAAQGCRLVLPAVAGPDAPLAFRLWQPGGGLEDGPYGTRHPPASSPQAAPGLLLVPLLAFDRHGYRLGYGGGFYDRTLADLSALGGGQEGREATAAATGAEARTGPVTVGVAWSAQEERPALAREPHDRPLQWLLTERGLRRAEPV